MDQVGGQWIAASGVVGLMAINITFVGLLLRAYATRTLAQDRTIKGQGDEIEKLKVDNFVCNQRNNLLVWTLQQNGIQVPHTYWELGTQIGEAHE